MKRPFFLVALMTLMALAASPTAGSPDLIDFRINDQHGALHTDARFTGKPLLVLWGDRQGSDFMEGWSRLLTESLRIELCGNQLRRLDVAHTKGAPFFVKGKIRNRFRENWPAPVLMDWKGKFRQAYNCPDDSCTILLFDAQGGLTRRWAVAAPDSFSAEKIMEATRKATSISR